MTYSMLVLMATAMPGQDFAPQPAPTQVRHYRVKKEKMSRRGPIRRLWDRIRGKKKQCDDCQTVKTPDPARPITVQNPYATPYAPVMPVPAVTVSKPVVAPTPISPPRPVVEEPVVKRPVSEDLLPKLEKKEVHETLKPTRSPESSYTVSSSSSMDKHYGHAPNYSWISGRLTRVHANGGMWIIRYASLDTNDKHGGSVVLAPTTNTYNYRDGDYVMVHGEILIQERASQYVGGALYRGDRLELLERPIGSMKWSK